MPILSFLLSNTKPAGAVACAANPSLHPLVQPKHPRARNPRVSTNVACACACACACAYKVLDFLTTYLPYTVQFPLSRPRRGSVAESAERRNMIPKRNPAAPQGSLACTQTTIPHHAKDQPLRIEQREKVRTIGISTSQFVGGSGMKSP